MILEAGRVLARSEIGDLGVVLNIAAPGIATQARAGQFVHVRPGARFDPLLRRPYSFNRIDRQAGEIELCRGHQVKMAKRVGIVNADQLIRLA